MEQREKIAWIVFLAGIVIFLLFWRWAAGFGIAVLCLEFCMFLYLLQKQKLRETPISRKEETPGEHQEMKSDGK